MLLYLSGSHTKTLRESSPFTGGRPSSNNNVSPSRSPTDSTVVPTQLPAVEPSFDSSKSSAASPIQVVRLNRMGFTTAAEDVVTAVSVTVHPGG
mmetsp:Transcript_33150/g.45452  ORF Transcript_33150/g.45452 Transcript_33150/m.45452 type:complete len:94 (-) Transcript_33150:302-583(-)